MSKKKKRIPPCPGDPAKYILVNTREGPHWRKKRGTDKPATLNAVFKNNVKLTKAISPVVSVIRQKLSPFLDILDTGRFVAKVSGLLKKEYNKTGKLDFLALKDYELQPYRPLQKLLRRLYKVSLKKNEAIIEIPLGEHAVKTVSKLVTGYYFEIILLYGDPTKPRSLRTDSDTSPVYDIALQKSTTCRLSVILPSKKLSWMIMLKLSCVLKNGPARHPQYYGMKVVWTERA